MTLTAKRMRTDHNVRVACILLAAGTSTRFRGDKLLYPIDGAPMASHAIRLHGALPYCARILVTQPRHAQLAALAEGAGFLVGYNDAPERGIASTIRIGIELLIGADAAAALAVYAGRAPHTGTRDASDAFPHSSDAADTESAPHTGTRDASDAFPHPPDAADTPDGILFGAPHKDTWQANAFVLSDDLARLFEPARAPDGILFGVCDQPYLARGTVERLLQWFADDPTRIVAPEADGHRGNPVIFPASLLPELYALSGDTGGAAVIRAHPDLLALVPVPPNELADIDTAPKG